MNARTKILMVALTAAFALSLAAGTASALRSLEIGGETTLNLNSRGITFSSELVEVICATTMTKTVSRTIPKTEGILIGKVTRVVVPARCRASGFGVTGEATVRIPGTGAETPNLWRIYYKSILGRLPEITGARFRIENILVLLNIPTIVGLVDCLFEGWIEGLAAVNRGVLGNLRSIGSENVVLRAAELNSGSCPATGRFEATGANGELVPLQTTTLRLL